MAHQKTIVFVAVWTDWFFMLEVHRRRQFLKHPATEVVENCAQTAKYKIDTSNAGTKKHPIIDSVGKDTLNKAHIFLLVKWSLTLGWGQG